MEGRGKSRRRSPYRVWKRRGSALLAVLLTLSLMLGDISGLSRVVMAGQGTVREEFRIHREDILKAAEEAIENGEPLSEPLAITSEEEKTEEKYQEILPADGSVYEIFPDIEQVKEVDSLELRIFIRLAEGADPASYTLTGDETLVFLYVNGGDVTAEGRVNIDGYVSEFTKVAAFEGEEEPMQSAGTTGAAPGNGAAGSGNGSGNGAAGGSGNAGNGTEAAESESSESGSMDPEDSAADLDGETEAESEEAGDGTSEDGMNPEETLPAETQEQPQEPESSAAEETEEAEQPSGEAPDHETPGDQTDGSEADGTASDENTEEAGTGSADEDKETAGNTENSGAEDNGTDNESDVNESDAADDVSEADEGSAEDNSQDDPADTENENAEADKEDGVEPEKSDTAENADSNAADEDNEAGSTVTLSLRNVQKVAASLASPSEAETPEADESQEGQEETEADEEDSYYEDNGDPVDEEDAAEDEEDIFKKTHDLKGRKYDEAVLDETVTVRAFAAGMEDAGFNREDLLEGAHQLTYTVAEGEARLIYTPEYVRDEAVVTFGIIPAEGMEVYQVTANGEALAETEETAAIASASEAKRAKASSSDADYDEERAVYYQIPQVLEDQTVEIQVVEEGYNSHPAFRKSKTFDNGVTVTVSAEEGILPAGTELQVEEVTEQVADAVAQKIEDSAEDSSKSVTSIIAYDINLIWKGEKLSNDWSKNGLVNVTFTGEPIEKLTDEAEKVEIFAIDDQEKEELSAQNADSISPETLILEPIQEEDVSGKATATVSYQAEHFTIYVISGTGGSGEAVSEYTMQVGDTITVYSSEMTYESWNRPSWKTSESGVVTIQEEGSQSVGWVSRPKAKIKAVNEGTVTVTVSKEGYWGDTTTDSFIIHVESKGPKTVTFNGNGATGNVPDAITNINPGTEITLPDADNLRKNGYSFIGWSKEKTTDEEKIGQGKVVIYPAGSEILVNENFTLYAIWVKSNPTDQAVHFFLRLDGTIQNEPSAETAASYTGHYNWRNNTPAALSGMYFGDDERVLKEAKFVTDPTGEAVVANLNKLPSDQAIVNAINLYSDAIQDNYGHVGEITLEEYEENFRVIWYVVKIPNDPDGYWHVDGVLLRKDQVTLSYDLNCTDYSTGSVTPSGGSYDEGSKVMVAGNSGFSRPGYIFMGWNTKKDGTGASYQPNDIIVMNEDTVLYAQWQNASAGLRLRKILEGGSGDVTQVSFSLYKATENWDKASETPLKTEIHPGQNGFISIQLEYDADNNRYLLYEETTAEGYQKLTDPIKLTVSFDSNNVITYQVEGNQETYSAANPYQIVNAYAGLDFAIHKVLVGGINGTDQVEQVSFQLFKFDETSNEYQRFGDPVFVVATEQDSISGHATFEEIPLGEYQLVELTTADGYVLYEPIDLKVTEAGDGSVILQVKEDSGWITVNSEKIMPVYTVNNERGVELPETGGPGLIMMERFGWMLLLLAMTGAEIQLLSRKRRKEQ